MATVAETTDIVADTREYEKWLGRFGALHGPDLAYKHEQMADPRNPFPFFRGTYYRWVRHWQAAPAELHEVPRVLAVGDLHLENFGTWRDSDGRLCWGVNDFDDTDELPYTNDLVRLAASVRFGRKALRASIKSSAACRAILKGYRECLQAGGRPFVLEERHAHLRTLAMAANRSPPRFWEKMSKLLSDPPVDLPPAAQSALTRDLPAENLDLAYRFRPRIGMGSLGKPRYVALAEWSGGWICREARLATPAATAWSAGATTAVNSRMAEVAAGAVRAPDPFYQPGPAWVVRRLAPHCSCIEFAHLDGADIDRLLHAMGAETANIHLGTSSTAGAILRDLEARPDDWLKDAARSLYNEIKADWKSWRRAGDQ